MAINRIKYVNVDSQKEESDFVKFVPSGIVLDTLSVTENGTYRPSGEIDGWNLVEVNVPQKVLTSITITENGTYTPSGSIDGWDSITVQTPVVPTYYVRKVLDNDSVLVNDGSYFPDLSNVHTIGANALSYALYSTTVTIGQNETYCAPFATGSNVTAGQNSLHYTFSGCTFINKNFSFSGITHINSTAMNGMLASSNVEKVYFFGLISIESSAFGNSSANYIFRNTTDVLEIHFPSALQTDVEAMTGYSSKWGATDAEIYFDL